MNPDTPNAKEQSTTVVNVTVAIKTIEPCLPGQQRQGAVNLIEIGTTHS